MVPLCTCKLFTPNMLKQNKQKLFQLEAQEWEDCRPSCFFTLHIVKSGWRTLFDRSLGSVTTDRSGFSLFSQDSPPHLQSCPQTCKDSQLGSSTPPPNKGAESTQVLLCHSGPSGGEVGGQTPGKPPFQLPSLCL